jgi:hypothetical protein
MNRNEALAAILDDLGLDTRPPVDVLRRGESFQDYALAAVTAHHAHMLFDSVQPGVCMACGMVSDNCEPDARTNWCECGAKKTVSLSVLLGVM